MNPRLVLANIHSSGLIQIWKTTFDLGGPHFPKIIRDEGALDFIATNLRDHTLRNADPYVIAGTALFQIVTFHPFMDCNHRTGWTLCLTIMHEFGYELNTAQENVIRFVKSIDTMDRASTVISWIQANFRRAR